MKITLTKNYSEFVKECKFFDCRNDKFVYTDWVGDADYIIATDLSEEDLIRKYPECVKALSPYILVSSAIGDVFTESRNNNLKHDYRMKGTYSIDLMEEYLVYGEHGMSSDSELSDEIRDALKSLTKVQRERFLLNVLDGRTYEEIGGSKVSPQAIKKSIDQAKEKLKKFLSKRV